MKLHDALRARRHGLGLSLTSLAEKSGYSPQAICCWENDQREWLSRLEDIAEALDCDIVLVPRK